MGGQHYDHPAFLAVHQERTNGQVLTNSAAAVTSHYINSTLKVWNKALVTGCTFTTISGGSAGGVVTIGIRRTNSISELFTITVSATGSALGTTYDLSLATGLTLTSIGEDVALVADSAKTIGDYGFVIGEIIWRYKLLPQDIPGNFKVG